MSSRKAAPGKWKELFRVLRKSIATLFYKGNISWTTKVKSFASLLPFYFKSIKLQSCCTFKSNKKIPLALHSSLSDSKWPFCNLYKRVSSCLWPFIITIFLPLKYTPVPKPNLNGSLSLLKGLLNLNRPVLGCSVESCENTVDMLSTEKCKALCPCLYSLESSRKYLHFLFIYTIILSLYQAVEKCTHIVGLIIFRRDHQNKRYFQLKFKFLFADRQHMGRKTGLWPPSVPLSLCCHCVFLWVFSQYLFYMK